MYLRKLSIFYAPNQDAFYFSLADFCLIGEHIIVGLVKI